MDIQDFPCALPQRCGAAHAAAWELNRGEDFPDTMTVFNLQSAMHNKARHVGLRCHTRRTRNNLQVQFFRPEES